MQIPVHISKLPIVLMGMPGCGKSTFGKKLAKALSRSFLDLDAEIESREGKTVKAIFAENGEDYFRLKEREVLLEVLQSSQPMVLSLGGGTPCFFDNLQRILHSSFCLYLEMTPAALLSRLLQAGNDRPLLQGLNAEEMKARLTNLYNERKEYFDQAHWIIPGLQANPVLVASLILKAGEN